MSLYKIRFLSASFLRRANKIPFFHASFACYYNFVKIYVIKYKHCFGYVINKLHQKINKARIVNYVMHLFSEYLQQPTLVLATDRQKLNTEQLGIICKSLFLFFMFDKNINWHMIQNVV